VRQYSNSARKRGVGAITYQKYGTNGLKRKMAEYLLPP
jgi:hypothetical protein